MLPIFLHARNFLHLPVIIMPLAIFLSSLPFLMIRRHITRCFQFTQTKQKKTHSFISAATFLCCESYAAMCVHDLPLSIFCALRRLCAMIYYGMFEWLIWNVARGKSYQVNEFAYFSYTAVFIHKSLVCRIGQVCSFSIPHNLHLRYANVFYILFSLWKFKFFFRCIAGKIDCCGLS